MSHKTPFARVVPYQHSIGTLETIRVENHPGEGGVGDGWTLAVTQPGSAPVSVFLENSVRDALIRALHDLQDEQERVEHRRRALRTGD